MQPLSKNKKCAEELALEETGVMEGMRKKEREETGKRVEGPTG